MREFEKFLKYQELKLRDRLLSDKISEYHERLKAGEDLSKEEVAQGYMYIQDRFLVRQNIEFYLGNENEKDNYEKFYLFM